MCFIKRYVVVFVMNPREMSMSLFDLCAVPRAAIFAYPIPINYMTHIKNISTSHTSQVVQKYSITVTKATKIIAH